MYMIPVALDNAVISYVSSAMGEGRTEKAKMFIQAGFWQCMFFGACCLGACLLWWDEIILLFLSDQEMVSQATTMMHIYYYGLLADFGQAVLAACLRALDRKKEGLWITVFAFYVVTIPLALTLCFQEGYGMTGLNWGVNAGLFVAFTLNAVFVLKTDYKFQSDTVIAKLKEDNSQQSIRRSKALEDEEDKYPDIKHEKLVESNDNSKTSMLKPEEKS
jgi:Na+-driven multidrug efflux pump